MSFESFIDKFQMMLVIFSENGEEKTDAQARRMLLSMCQTATDQNFQVALTNLRYRSRRDEITFDEMVADMATTVAEGKPQSGSKFGVFAVDTHRDNSKTTTKFLKSKEWYKLSREERQRITEERKKQGIGASKTVKSLRETTKAQKRQISALQSKISALQSDGDKVDSHGVSESGGNDDASKRESSNAGTAFGGKNEAKRRKAEQ